LGQGIIISFIIQNGITSYACYGKPVNKTTILYIFLIFSYMYKPEQQKSMHSNMLTSWHRSFNYAHYRHRPHSSSSV